MKTLAKILGPGTLALAVPSCNDTPTHTPEVPNATQSLPNSYFDLSYLGREEKPKKEINYSPERFERFKKAFGNDKYNSLTLENKKETEEIFSKQSDLNHLFAQELICQCYETPAKMERIVYERFGEDRRDRITPEELKNFRTKMPWINETDKLSEGDKALNYILDAFVDEACRIAARKLNFF